MEPKTTQERGKTPNTQTGSNPTQTGNQPGTPTMSGQSTGTATARQQTPSRTEEIGNEMRERGAEIADRAKETFNQAYERTSQTLNNSYEQAMDYGREHPGQAILIAFGVGIGVGLWLSSTVSPRSRTSRLVPPVMNALSEIAEEMFRR